MLLHALGNLFLQACMKMTVRISIQISSIDIWSRGSNCQYPGIGSTNAGIVYQRIYATVATISISREL